MARERVVERIAEKEQLHFPAFKPETEGGNP
jgi:hypothetical protein